MVNLRWSKFVSLVAFVLVAVLISSSVTATVWARPGEDGAGTVVSSQVTPRPGRIIVDKVTIPAGATDIFNFTASYSPGSFSLTDAAPPNDSGLIPPGTYTITENAKPGWYLNGSVCQSGATAASPGSSTTFGSTATINLAAGVTVTCTFTNTKMGRIIVDKVTVPAGDPTVFQFTAGYQANFSLTDTATPNDSGPLSPATYALNETAVPGWTTSLACADPDGGTAQSGAAARIDLDAGETIICTFTNTKTVVDVKPGTIIVTKNAVPDDPLDFEFGGSWLPGSFYLDDDGVGGSPMPNTQTFANLPPGPYTVKENVALGWVLSIACTDPTGGTTVAGSSASISLASSETVTCIFTNTKTVVEVKPGTIIVTKNAVPDDPLDFEFGGSWLPGSFYLDDDGVGGSPMPNTQTFTNLPPGPYTVKENVPPGWVLSIACADPNGNTTVVSNSANIGLDPGETVTCTFTNTKIVVDVKPGRIIVDKVTIPANDPTIFQFTTSYLPGSFSLTDAALPNDSGPLPSATYSVSENTPSGWTLTSAMCTDGSPVGAIVLDPGETVTCRFVNTKIIDVKPGTIIIKKIAVPNGTQTFEFGGSWGQFFLQDPASTYPNMQTFANLTPGPYTAKENVPPGWVISIACADPDGGTTAVSYYADIDLDAGETITCTFTNRKIEVKPGRIIVDKVTIPANDPTVFQFTTSYPPGSFSLTDAALPNDSGLLTPATYSVSESTPSGWILTSATCSDGSQVGAIVLDPGETVTCRFVNTKRDVPPPPPATYIYSAKIVCGTVTPPGPRPELPTLLDTAPVVPGLYRSAINIHNFWEKDTAFLQKVAIAMPQDQPLGPVTQLVQTSLGPNGAVEVDCYNIVAILAGTASAKAEFLKGFLIIESPVELGVTAVYTVENLQQKRIKTDVEQIQYHVVRQSGVRSGVVPPSIAPTPTRTPPPPPVATSTPAPTPAPTARATIITPAPTRQTPEATLEAPTLAPTIEATSQPTTPPAPKGGVGCSRPASGSLPSSKPDMNAGLIVFGLTVGGAFVFGWRRRQR